MRQCKYVPEGQPCTLSNLHCQAPKCFVQDDAPALAEPLDREELEAIKARIPAWSGHVPVLVAEVERLRALTVGDPTSIYHEYETLRAERDAAVARADRAEAEVERLRAENTELRAEIARNHADFEQWEAMAAKGAGRAAELDALREQLTEARKALTDERWEHQPKGNEGKEPYGCTWCFPKDGDWPCASAEAIDRFFERFPSMPGDGT